MSTSGYVKVYRSLQDHPIWVDARRGPFSEGQAWIDLILLAAWEPHFVKIKNQDVLVDRGDVVASVRFLMKRWRWGAGKTQRFLEWLEADKIVSKKQNGSGNGSPSVYSIVNYDLYQGGDDTSGTVNGTVAERLRDKTKKLKKESTTLSGSEKARPPEPHLEQAREVLDHLNLAAKSNYRPVPTTLSLIAARLREGATVADCRRVIDTKVAKWSADPKMAGYLRPKTLFSATNFAQYVGEPASKPTEPAYTLTWGPCTACGKVHKTSAALKGVCQKAAEEATEAVRLAARAKVIPIHPLKESA